jgi:hypothetical protein
MMSEQKHAPYRYYTPEEIRFIKKEIKGRGYAELTDLFNKHFGLRGKKKLTFKQMNAFLNNHKLRNGRDCRFRPGQAAHNKGRKGYCSPGSEKGWFKKGQRPWTYMPVGSKRINCYGYLDIKIADPNVWKAKHVLLWEKAHGPVPKGHVVIFADGNKSNIRLSNLLLVSRSELAVMNRLHLISARKDLTKFGKTIADIKILIAERKRELKKKPLSKRSEP